jgi:TolB protein
VAAFVRWFAGGLAAAVLVVPATASATFPGENGKIAYEGPGLSGISSSSIFSMNPNGTGKTNLTSSPAKGIAPRGTSSGSYDPSYSADGHKITFERVAQGQFTQDIWVMNADGTGATNITNTPTVREMDPAFSPDGSKIAFIREPDEQPQQLWVMNANGSSGAAVSGAVGTDSPQDPEFSPDGSKIAFDASVPPKIEIFTVGANGQGLANITSAVPGANLGPSWSPDGNRIAFSNQASQAAETNILVIGAEGGATTDLTSAVTGASVVEPTFSPDGTLIAYARDDGSDGNDDIFTMRSADGLGQTNITSDTASEDDHPSWGPVPVTPPPPATDTDPPETTITKQPENSDKTSAKLAFSSSEAGSIFECALKGKGVDKDLKQFKPCNSGKVKYRHLEPGKKKFSVRATDASGNVDSTPAKAKWKVLSS